MVHGDRSFMLGIMFNCSRNPISDSVQKRNGTKTDLNAARNVINKNNYVLLTAVAVEVSPAASESSNSFLKLWRLWPFTSPRFLE